MNNRIHNIFKQEELINKRYKIKLQILNISKIIFSSLIFMIFLVQAFCENHIIITNPGNCPFNIDSSIIEISQVENENKKKLTFKNGANSAKNLLKDCKEITDIEISTNTNSFLTDISGMFEGCINLQKITFNSFNTYEVFNMSRMFYNCPSLTSISFGDNNGFVTNSVKDMSYMFFNCSSLPENQLHLDKFNTQKVTNMSHMFELCSNFNYLNFPNSFSTSNVENMEYMFSNCEQLKSINVRYFDTNKVINMNSMFKNCKKLNPITITNFKTNSLVNMGSMFQSCSSLENIDLSSFVTTSVKFMNDLFHDCTNLKFYKISNFFTENVIKMESMFENCEKLSILNLSNFYTPSLRQMYSIFSGCTGVEIFDISKFDTFQVTNFANLFYNCHSLNSINITHFVTDMASDMNHMFFNCSKLTFLNLSTFKTERVLRMDSMFQGCSKLSNLIISNFQNNQVMDMNHMFAGCASLIELDLSKFYTKEVKNMNSLFSGCSQLKSLVLSSFDTTNVLNMNSIFYGCSSLTSINFGTKFKTKNVVDMGYMFYDCSSLLSIDLSKLETENVNSFDSMFYNCKSLKSLSVNEFETSKAISMKSMFHGCPLIETINLSKFNTQKVEHMEDLFYGCSSLIRLDISHFDVKNVNSMSYMFYECKSLTSIKLPNLRPLIVHNTEYMFAGCSSLSSLDLNFFDASKVKFMDYMFSGCNYLKHLNLANWEAKVVETMNYMFSGCSSLTSLNLESFTTSALQSMKGLFYGCSSLKFMDLSRLNTSQVKSMEYMFYKAISLKSINFNYSTSGDSYFSLNSVKNMRYMFAYCSSLEYIDISYFKTPNLVDMSYMFYECNSLTSANLSNFTTSNVKTMEKIFYNCNNLYYINLYNTIEANDINLDNFLHEDSIPNMVFCINNISQTPKIYLIINNKSDCSIVNCSDDYILSRKLLINENDSIGYTCIEPQQGEEKCGQNYFYYLYHCYVKCPDGTKNDVYENKICFKENTQPPACTIQKYIIDLVYERNCSDFSQIKDYENYNESLYGRQILLNQTIKEFFIDNDTFVSEHVSKIGMAFKEFFNDTIYEVTTLSDKNLYDNLTYINIQDCENLLKKNKRIPPNEDLFLLKIEYSTDEFKIPIIEYVIFFKNGTRLNISDCDCMKFVYSIPVDIIKYDINESLIYKYNPSSEYNNDLCYQYTTENNTDITLYDRRKEFNDNNLSLCESNCTFLNYDYDKHRVQCQCPIKHYFNQFLYEEPSKKDLIFRFHDNHEQSSNLVILKCFKMLFTKLCYNENYPSILYIILIIGNLAAAIFFCVTDYKNLYSQIQSFTERLKRTKNKKNINQRKNNIITTGNNPPPKINAGNMIKKPKNNLISKFSGKNNGFTNKFSSKVKAQNSLISSRNMMKNATDRSLNILNKDDIFFDKTEMEINMLSYTEAQKTDKRGCFGFYFSFLKTRQLLLFILASDYNSFIVKICFISFVFGICVGINTFFFTDKVIHRYYVKQGKETFSDSIISHLSSIIISTIIASIIKSIMLLLTFTDTDVIQIKDNSTMSREEKTNRALIKVTSKSTLFFIINFITMTLFWIYVGTFGIVFKNTQLYLLVNGVITFGGILILPFFYCLISAAMRMIALSGKDNESLYKFSQFLELI